MDTIKFHPVLMQTAQMSVCLECGCPVMVEYQDLHKKWHDDLAVAISRLEIAAGKAS